jgi:hypothetical protein
MSRTPEEFAKHYAQMSEVELMELAQAYDSLTDIAKDALRAEFARRNLEPPLVEEAEEAAQPAGRELVTLRRYRDLTEADLARSLLAAAGIQAWTRDENLVRLDWFYSNLVGGIRLQVDAADAQAAEEVLDQPAPGAIQFGREKEFVQPQCPRCGSFHISLPGSMDTLAPVQGTTALPPGSEAWVCGACGTCWEETEDPQTSEE